MTIQKKVITVVIIASDHVYSGMETIKRRYSVWEYTGFMGKSKKISRLTPRILLKKGVPMVLVPGIMLAICLGWTGSQLRRVDNYQSIKTVFPDQGMVAGVEDGDTFILKNGVRVRMLGIDAPDRGENNYGEAKARLSEFINDKKVYLEYDRYQDDKYGRVLAWVWVGCEGKPEFMPPDYMRLSANSSKAGITENPKGCKNGQLVNEEMVKSGLVVFERYKDRGELKYEGRILQ